jgi:NAD(P)-dependent dehydrogenase (short-subunit alcohol dehydrogenase family)
MGRCQGRVAIVTGASRGIGRGIAERLASEGAAVAVTARSLDTAPEHLGGTLLDLVSLIQSRGGRAIAIQSDLSDPEDRARIVPETEKQLGPVDILVNNAAASFYIPFEQYSKKRFRVMSEINFNAPWDLCQQVVPGMRERRSGWIVNVSSATAIHHENPFPKFAATGGSLLYGSTKAALNRFTNGLAAELQPFGIAVNSIEPVAAVITPGVKALGIDTQGAVVEPVEAMAEATLALATCDPVKIAGRIAQATPLLEELGVPVRTLDGSALYEG